MQFNQAIPLLSRPKYAEGTKLSSERDSRNNSQLWKKGALNTGQTDSLSQAVQKLSREVAKQRRRIVGGYIPTPQNEQMFPFKIYQIDNASATADQKKIYTDLGLDINDYTIQIRSGYVSARPYLYPYQLNQQGNYEDLVYCYNTDVYPFPGDFFYYQPVANTFQTIITPNSGDIEISTNSQIAINPIPTNGSQFASAACSFWVEIFETLVGGLQQKLWARAITYDPPDWRNPQFFPSGKNIIPIGIFGLYANPNSPTGNYLPFVPFIDQIQTGNLVNRFQPTLGDQRGVWSELFAALPPTATNLVFYPGDIVTDDSVKLGNLDSNGDIIQSYGVYICVATSWLYPIITDTPNGNPDWKLISNLLTDYAP